MLAKLNDEMDLGDEEKSHFSNSKYKRSDGVNTLVQELPITMDLSMQGYVYAPETQ